MEKTIVSYQNKKYEVWASAPMPGENLKTYSAWAYNNEAGDERVGLITWDTLKGWENHRYNQDTGTCAVEGCDGFCEDEANACNWDIYRFELTEMYANMGPEDLLAKMKEIK